MKPPRGVTDPERFHEQRPSAAGRGRHPDHRGRGYGAALTHRVAQRIQARGETPFLHVFPHNTGAIAIYEALGFRLRREMTLTVIVRA